MTDYTPTIDEARRVYAAMSFRSCFESEGGNQSTSEWRAEFDRFLDQVRADAWDEGVEIGNYYAEDMAYAPVNPYRKDQR